MPRRAGGSALLPVVVQSCEQAHDRSRTAAVRRTPPRAGPGGGSRTAGRGRRGRSRLGRRPAGLRRGRRGCGSGGRWPGPTSQPCTVISRAAVATRSGASRPRSPTSTGSEARPGRRPGPEQRTRLLPQRLHPGARRRDGLHLDPARGGLGERVEGVLHVREQVAQRPARARRRAVEVVGADVGEHDPRVGEGAVQQLDGAVERACSPGVRERLVAEGTWSPRAISASAGTGSPGR